MQNSTLAFVVVALLAVIVYLAYANFFAVSYYYTINECKAQMYHANTNYILCCQETPTDPTATPRYYLCSNKRTFGPHDYVLVNVNIQKLASAAGISPYIACGVTDLFYPGPNTYDPTRFTYVAGGLSENQPTNACTIGFSASDRASLALGGYTRGSSGQVQLIQVKIFPNGTNFTSQDFSSIWSGSPLALNIVGDVR